MARFSVKCVDKKILCVDECAFCVTFLIETAAVTIFHPQSLNRI